MPMLESAVAITTSQQPSNAALPAKQRPELIADERHEAAQRAEQVERHAVEPGEPGAVGVAGPASAALGEEHDREPHALRELEQPVLLAMVLQPLCAGEHGVVVRHHDAAGLAVGEQVAVHPADAGDEAVGRSARDQIVQRAASTLRRDHE